MQADFMRKLLCQLCSLIKRTDYSLKWCHSYCLAYEVNGMRRVLLAICSPAFPQVEFWFRGVSNDSCLGNQSTGVVFSEKWNRKCYIFILPLHHLVIQVPQVKCGTQNASPTTETAKKKKKKFPPHSVLVWIWHYYFLRNFHLCWDY